MAKLAVTEVDKSIGKKIQIRRKELGLTAAELSEKVGISQQQLSRYERGTNKINVTHLFNIAYITRTPISWFFASCTPEMAALIVQSEAATYSVVADHELTQRLTQVWSKLSLEQQKSVISLLDQM
ncbi:helix-turn-helix domain-containing protein [Hydrogenovibrio marinus]|uniref:HTH cro/C1-type domain-containing protein n=1 Tax=Hydrogenovibrio marinus TaxID=28885 RepID=A0A066ZRZ3_HYDMR|nr:helix-turn-helix transcriptional regulator [Hydrogenovibrio marinus]KDN96578.1 hypothetical protein EI16_10000 [Hydrogenovibrio marinus]BBN60214.1 transcriptional regulator [Hydrogenovibrio marinus]